MIFISVEEYLQQYLQSRFRDYVPYLRDLAGRGAHRYPLILCGMLKWDDCPELWCDAWEGNYVLCAIRDASARKLKSLVDLQAGAQLSAETPVELYLSGNGDVVRCAYYPTREAAMAGLTSLHSTRHMWQWVDDNCVSY